MLIVMKLCALARTLPQVVIDPVSCGNNCWTTVVPPGSASTLPAQVLGPLPRNLSAGSSHDVPRRDLSVFACVSSVATEHKLAKHSADAADNSTNRVHSVRTVCGATMANIEQHVARVLRAGEPGSSHKRQALRTRGRDLVCHAVRATCLLSDRGDGGWLLGREATPLAGARARAVFTAGRERAPGLGWLDRTTSVPTARAPF